MFSPHCRLYLAFISKSDNQRSIFKVDEVQCGLHSSISQSQSLSLSLKSALWRHCNYTYLRASFLWKGQEGQLISTHQAFFQMKILARAGMQWIRSKPLKNTEARKPWLLWILFFHHKILIMERGRVLAWRDKKWSPFIWRLSFAWISHCGAFPLPFPFLCSDKLFILKDLDFSENVPVWSMLLQYYFVPSNGTKQKVGKIWFSLSCFIHLVFCENFSFFNPTSWTLYLE